MTQNTNKKLLLSVVIFAVLLLSMLISLFLYGETYADTEEEQQIRLRSYDVEPIPLVYKSKNRKLRLMYEMDTDDYSWDTKIVILRQGKDFKISKGRIRKKVGRYKVRIKGIGKYTGSFKLTVSVVPRAPRGVRTVSKNAKKFTIRWTKPKYGKVDGYVVTTLRDDDGYGLGLPPSIWEKTYYTKGTSITIPTREDFYIHTEIQSYKIVKGKKIFSNGKNHNDDVRPTGIPAYYLKQKKGSMLFRAKRTGDYQLYVSKTRNFRKGTYDRYNGVNSDYSVVVRYNKKLRGKTRYVKLRQYTKVGKKYLYGKWTKVRKIKLK